MIHLIKLFIVCYTALLSCQTFFRVSIQIEPNRMTYQVGDTVSIGVYMSDSVFDMNTGYFFKIRNFPFQPVMGLYNFDSNGTHQNRGFDTHEVILQEIYEPVFRTIISAKTKYSDNTYHFKITFVLRTKGKYVFTMQDAYGIYKAGGNPDRWTMYADTITFDGKCQDCKFKISNEIDGNNHLDGFEKELVFIDKELNFDNYKTKKYEKSWQSPYGSGLFVWEETGTYCFEVK